MSVIQQKEYIFRFIDNIKFILNLQRIISAPQLSAPVIIIRIELIITPDRANAKKRRRVPALNNVSTPAPRHPSLLKNL